MPQLKLKRLQLKLYDSLLRSGIKFDKTIQTKNGNIEREIRRLGYCYPPKINRRYDSMKNAIKTCFRDSKDSEFNTDKVFYGMKQINNRLNIISTKNGNQMK